MCRVVRCVTIIAIAIGIPLQSVAQPSQAGAPTIKSSTELVLVPAVVQDKSGAAITDLKREDFLLKQDGKPQSITVFEQVNPDSSPVRRSDGSPQTFSNFGPRSGEYHRLIIIVLDFANTPYADQANARKELLKFLSDVAERGQPMCLFALTRYGLSLLQNFTDDPKVLAAALREAPSHNAPLIHEPQTVPGEFGPELGFLERIIRANLQGESRMDSLVTKAAASVTSRALRQIATAFRGMPGRKSLIWASSGFPFSISSPAHDICEPGCPDRDAYDHLWRMMNDAQIAIYSVDLRAASLSTAQNPGGVRPSEMGDTDFDSDTEARWKREDSSNTLRLFAENTGGKAFLGGADLIRAFREATQDDSSYYMLGYYLTRNTKPGWHSISVTTVRKGVRLRFRNGLLVTRDASQPSARSDMQLAVTSPFDFVGMPVSVTLSGQKPDKSAGKTRVQFDLVMPPSFASVDEADQNHMIVDIAAVARNLKGEVAAELYQRIDSHLKADGLEQIQNNGMTYRNGLSLPAGEYRVRFIVRDSLGNRMGSVAAPVTVAP